MTKSSWRDDLAQQLGDVTKLADFPNLDEVSILIDARVASLSAEDLATWDELQGAINREPFCGAAPRTLRFLSASRSPVSADQEEITLAFAYRPLGYHGAEGTASLRIYPEMDFDRLP